MSKARFEFAEIPEIAFVDQYAEHEELGIFVIDPQRRTAPGDLWWMTNTRLQAHDRHGGGDYTTRYPVELETVTGTSPAGLSFDSATSVLRYDGTATGIAVRDFTARLKACTDSAIVYSQPFKIRILQPKVVYGDNAANYVKPGWGAVPVDPLLGGTWYGAVKPGDNDVNNNLQVGTESAPAVIFIVPGTYDYQRTVKPLKYMYVMGHPVNRPYMREGNVGTGGDGQFILFKNLESTDCRMAGLMWDQPICGFVISKVYSHDWTNSQNAIGTTSFEGYGRKTLASRGVKSLLMSVSNCKFTKAGGVALQHPMYMEGRPTARLQVNNCYLNGARQASLSKTTARFASWMNSFFSPVSDWHDPLADKGGWASKAIDCVAASFATVYNCDFISLYASSGGGYGPLGGTQNGVIHWRARNDLVGSEWPWTSEASQDSYTDAINNPRFTGDPNALLVPPRSGAQAGEYEDPVFSSLGWSCGPDTFDNPEFWDAVAALPQDDPHNPYIYKKFVSYCRITYVTLNLPGCPSSSRRYSWMQDDGTFPMTNSHRTGGPFYVLTAPANWVPRSCTFTANNIFTGWTATDAANPERWAKLDSPDGAESPDGYYGPGPWPDPTMPRALVYLGGDSGPHPQAAVGVNASGVPTAEPAHVEVPDWFRFGGASTIADAPTSIWHN